MRKHYLTENKQNRYDQVTNLGIQIESTLAREFFLPKIYSRYVDYEAKQLQSQHKAKEEKEIYDLKSHLDKLKSQLNRLDDKKSLYLRLQTQKSETNNYQPFYYPQNLSMGGGNCQQKCNRNAHSSRYTDYSHGSDQNIKSKISIHLQSNNDIGVRKTMAHKKNKKKNQNQTKKKTCKNPKLRRKFRVAVYAVYFSLFLPSFSRKIYKNRILHHMKLYPHEMDKKLLKKQQQNPSKFRNDEKNIFLDLEYGLQFKELTFDFGASQIFNSKNSVRDIKVHFQTLLETYDDNSDKKITKKQPEKDHLEEQLFFKKNQQILVPKLQTFFMDFFDKLNNIVQSEQFLDEYWQTLSLQTINNSLVHNSNAKIPKKVIDSGMVRLHQNRQIIFVFDEQTESFLMMLDLILKIFTYNYYLKLSKDDTMKKQDRILTNFILTVMNILCGQVFDDKMTEYYEQFDIDSKTNARNKQFKPLRDLYINKKSKTIKDKKFIIIKDLPFFYETKKFLSEQQGLVNNIKTVIKQFSYNYYQLIKAKFTGFIKQIKEKTLEEKYLMKNDKQRPENQMIYEELSSNLSIQMSGSNKKTKLMKIKTKNNSSNALTGLKR